jgi:hypothetical protein
MKYLQKSFFVPYIGKTYRDNWERAFGKVVRFDLSLFATLSGEEFGCWLEMNQEIMKYLLSYESLIIPITLPYLFIAVPKPNDTKIIIETEWQTPIGYEEFAINQRGIHISVIDDNGIALSTEAITWSYLKKIAEGKK